MPTITLNHQTHTLIPIRTFRAEHHLPNTFGVAQFEPKDYTGLAALDQAGPDLRWLRTHVLAAIPAQIAHAHRLMHIDELEAIFGAALRHINPRIGLREPEIDFALASFGDVCRAWVYALVRARGTTPDFAALYGEWLAGSVRISSQEHPYEHKDSCWTIRILNAIYGRMGLEVTTPVQTFYISDSVYTCPAEGFMAALLQDVAVRLQGG